MKIKDKAIRKAVLVLISIIIFFQTQSLAYATGFDVDKTYQSVFIVISEELLGSGFAIGQNSIITNAHVVGNNQKVEIENINGKTYIGHVVSIDTNLDLAVVIVEGAKFQPIILAADSEVITGSDVYALGSPEGFSFTITKGILSAKDREVEEFPGLSFHQTDAPTNPGNSGGPLLNNKGRAIGVNTLKWYGMEGITEGISFSIPVSTVRDYLKNNGFSVDKRGNISGYLNLSDYKSFIDGTDLSADERSIRDLSNKLKNANRTNNILTGIAISSIAANIVLVLIVLLIKMRKEKSSLNVSRSDSRNRTNFDIDIMG